MAITTTIAVPPAPPGPLPPTPIYATILAWTGAGKKTLICKNFSEPPSLDLFCFFWLRRVFLRPGLRGVVSFSCVFLRFSIQLWLIVRTLVHLLFLPTCFHNWLIEFVGACFFQRNAQAGSRMHAPEKKCMGQGGRAWDGERMRGADTHLGVIFNDTGLWASVY